MSGAKMECFDHAGKIGQRRSIRMNPDFRFGGIAESHVTGAVS